MTSKRVETALAFIGHYATLDADILEKVLADNYIHDYAPSSIPRPGPFDKQGMIDLTRHMRTLLSGYPMVVKEALESEKSNAVTLWATATSAFHEEVKDDGLTAEEWVHKGEYIYLLYMDETGEKITKVLEFVDSKGTIENMVMLVQRATENLAKKNGPPAN